MLLQSFHFSQSKAICYLLCNLNILSSLRRQPEGVFAKGHASPGTRLNMQAWSSIYWHFQKDDPNGDLCNERLMLKWKLPGNLLSISISIKFPWLALRSSDLNQTIITGHRTWNVLFGKICSCKSKEKDNEQVDWTIDWKKSSTRLLVWQLFLCPTFSTASSNPER